MWEGFVSPILILSSVGGNSISPILILSSVGTLLWEGFVSPILILSSVGGNSLGNSLVGKPDSPLKTIPLPPSSAYDTLAYTTAASPYSGLSCANSRRRCFSSARYSGSFAYRSRRAAFRLSAYSGSVAYRFVS